VQCKFPLLIKTVSLDLNDKVGECFVDGCLWFSISLIDSEHIYIYILFVILLVVVVVLGIIMVVKTFISSKICGYHSGISENSSLVECDTVSLGD
jgi:hypothetical protein